MRIPEIRGALIDISYQVGTYDGTLARQIRYLANATKRRSPIRRARVKKPKLTWQMKRRIIKYAARHPDASYLEISHALDINTGRISEALRGFRK